MKFDKDKFIFHELYVNSETGKSSGSGFIGVWGGIIGILAFIATIVAYFMKLPFAAELMGHVVFWMGIVSALLGVRKIWKDTPTTNREEGMDV